MTAGNPTLIFDGNCGFCRRWVERVRRWDRQGRISFLPYQSPELAVRFPQVSRAECALRIHFVRPDGTVFSGAAAGREVLRLIPGGRAWILPLQLPGSMPIAERIYTWVTKRWGPVSTSRSTG